MMEDFAPTSDTHALRSQIYSLEEQLRILKCILAKAEDSTLPEPGEPCEPQPRPRMWPLEPGEYRRYGRQMILPQIGLEGQLKLRNAKVLVIGLGGLGCPAALYLAGAGCGTMGLVDGDHVELSNLHRQILHTTDRVGRYKVDSARTRLYELNPNVQCIVHPEHITATTAVDLISAYDLILDCTDHPTSRYLISDAAVIAGKPLVSASALQTEGQLLILNHPPSKFDGSPSGPCYRCVFPKPPPPESITTCGDGGVLGPVVGTMGVLMALEAIKLVTAVPAHDGASTTKFILDEPNKPSSMLIFSAFGSPPFRSVRLRGRRSNCASCSANPSITADSLRSGSLDYAQFCGLTHPVTILAPGERLAAKDLKTSLQGKERPIVIDVRDPVQFEICHLGGSINIPYSGITSMTSEIINSDGQTEATKNATLETISSTVQSHPDNTPICFICRFGNDSQLAVNKFKELNYTIWANRMIRDVKGGFEAWRREVDSTWPEY